MDIRKLKKLKDGSEDTFKNLKVDEDAEKLRTERMREISDAPQLARQLFWCDVCRQDFETLAYRAVFSWQDELLAKYVALGKHKDKQGDHCSRQCIRYITEPNLDPYFRHSDLVKKQQRKYANDLLQPGDPGFKTLYGDPMKDRNDLQEKKERAEHALKHGL